MIVIFVVLSSEPQDRLIEAVTSIQPRWNLTILCYVVSSDLKRRWLLNEWLVLVRHLIFLGPDRGARELRVGKVAPDLAL